MPQQYLVTIFFNTDRLGNRAFDLHSREALLTEEIDSLRKRLPFLTKIAPLVTSCAATTSVNGNDLQELVSYLDANSERLQFDIDGDRVMRAARGNP